MIRPYTILLAQAVGVQTLIADCDHTVVKAPRGLEDQLHDVNGIKALATPGEARPT